MHNQCFLLKKKYLVFFCVYECFAACTSMHLLHAVSEEAGKERGDAEEGMGLLGSRVTESCEVPCGCRNRILKNIEHF